MTAILAITLPVYLLIAAGFGAVRVRYVQGDDVRALARVVMRVCLPATIFVSISRVPVAEAIRWDFVAGYLFASLAVFAAGYLAGRRLLGMPHGGAVLMGLGMSGSNSAFMGFPIAAMVLGDAALSAFAMAMLVENIVMMPLAVVCADAPAPGGRARQIVTGMAKNPLLIAVAAGVAFSLSGLALPVAVERTLAMLAPVAPPVALLAVGGIVAAQMMDPPATGPGTGPWPVAMTIAGKLVLHPLAVAGAFMAMGTLPQGLMIAGIIIAAVPMMSIFALFGQRWGHEGLAARSLIGATTASFLTVSALLWAIGPL
jgi:malonate transporter and related proteins